MIQPDPVDLLKSKASELKKALEKSIKAFNDGRITFDTHKTHSDNLKPLINKYEISINLLQNHA